MVLAWLRDGERNLPSLGEEENDGDSFFPGFVILFRGVLFLTKHPFCSTGHWAGFMSVLRKGIYPELLFLLPASLLHPTLSLSSIWQRVEDPASLLRTFNLWVGGAGPSHSHLSPSLKPLLPQQGSEPTGEARSKGSFLHTWHRPQHRSGQAFRSEGTALKLPPC